MIEESTGFQSGVSDGVQTVQSKGKLAAWMAVQYNRIIKETSQKRPSWMAAIPRGRFCVVGFNGVSGPRSWWVDEAVRVYLN